MREFLKGLDLDNETVDTIMAEYGKNMQGLKEQNETLRGENKTLKEEAEANKKIDIEAIKKEEFEKGKTEGSKEVETFKKSIALERALAETKAKDVKLLEKMIDNEKINYQEKDGDFTISGLDDQIKNIKETHSYLFEQEQDNSASLNLGGEHTSSAGKNEATTLASALHQKYDKN